MKITCFTISEFEWNISLIQNGKDNFTVKYGKETRSNLDYASAACQFGGAVMHALACEGRLDNRMEGER